MRVRPGWRVVVSGLAGVCVSASVAFGQSAPPRYEGTAELAFVGVSGNASSNTFGLGAESVSRPDSWVVRNKLSIVRNETSGVTTAQSFLYAPRVEKTFNPRLSAFGEYGYFRDRFAGVANRHAVTAGLTIKVLARASQSLTIDGGAGYLNEDRVTGDDLSNAVYTAGSAFLLKLSPTADITDTLKVVGSAVRTSDWRIDHTVAVSARLTTSLSLKVSQGVRYAHFPAPGFKRTDTITSVALVAKVTRP